jgi:methionyl-tRNA formyltransferase
MRLVFAGTPAAAIPSLDALLASRHEIAAVISRADAPIGRKHVLTPSAVTARAEERGVPVIRTNRLDDAVTEQVARIEPDLGVIVAYGGLVREPLLSLPRLGWINLHFSLLPRWRGAAPVQRAIIAGDAVTGAAVFQLVPALDAGAVFARLKRPIAADETAGEVLDALAVSGAGLLAEVVDSLADGVARASEQTGEPTIAPKLTIDDAELSWDAPAGELYDRLRGVTPEPGAFTHVDGERLKVLAARPASEEPIEPGTFASVGGRVLIGTATDPIQLLTVQPAGRKPMAAADWWRGRPAGSAPVAR